MYFTVYTMMCMLPSILVTGRGPLTTRMKNYVSDAAYPLAAFDDTVDIVISFNEETSVRDLCHVQDHTKPKLAIFVCPMSMDKYHFESTRYKQAIFDRFQCKCFTLNTKRVGKIPLEFEQTENELVISAFKYSLDLFHNIA